MRPLLAPGEELTLIGSDKPDTLLAGSTPPGAACLTSPVSPFSLRQQLTIPRLLRQERIDVYHSTYYLMPYRTGIPTVLTVYDLIPIRCASSVSRGTALLFRLCHRLALSAATRVIAISAATRDDLLDYYKLPPERVQVIRLGVSAHFTPASRSEIECVLQKYSLPVRFVLYVGINKPHKNLSALVQAWSALRAKGADPPLLAICGPWDSRFQQVPTLIERLTLGSLVRLLGPVARGDLPALYSAARLFVFPSLYEGFGLPVLESMACGTPVACSDIPALREVADQAAAYFDPQQIDSIAEATRAVLGDLSRSSELRGLGLARSQGFSWGAAAEETIRLYRKMVD